MKNFITLRAARVNAGLTIKEAAQRIGVNESTIINWEKNPSIVRAIYREKIQEVYQYPLDNIFFAK